MGRLDQIKIYLFLAQQIQLTQLLQTLVLAQQMRLRLQPIVLHGAQRHTYFVTHLLGITLLLLGIQLKLRLQTV